MLAWKLGWRSLLRNKRRTAITMAVIVLCYSLLVVSLGLSHGGHADMAEIGIRLGQSHIVVEHEAYADALTLDYPIDDPRPITELAQAGEYWWDRKIPRDLLAAARRAA